MQTRSLVAVFAVVLSAIIFSSCSKSNELGRYIPNDAGLVLHLNGKSLSEKLPWNEVKQSEWFKTIYNDTAMAGYMKTALDNPENTGIDMNDDLVFFVKPDSSGGYMAIQGMLKDAARFSQFNKQANPTAVETTADGVNYLRNDKMIASWKKDRFTIVVSTPPMAEMDKNFPRFDSAGVVVGDSVRPLKPVVVRNLQADAAGLYALDKKLSLANEERFSHLLDTKADLHFWVNSEAIYKSSGMGSMASMSMMNLGKMYEGARMAGSANFEDGRITVDARSYAGKEMADLWKKYEGNKISSDMAGRITSKNIAAFISLNFKPEIIREFLKLLGMEGFANMGSAFLGFNLDDFIKANKGDILLTVSDIRKDSLGKPAMDVMFSAAIGDKPSFDKLINAGKKLGEEKFGNALSNAVFYNSNNQYFAIGNNKQAVDAFFTTGNTKLAFFDQLSGSPAAAYINFQYILNAVKSYQTNMEDSLSSVTLDASVKMWDYLVATGGEVKNNAIIQHLEVNLVDKKTNSLKQLNNYLAIISSAVAKKKAAGNSDWDRQWNSVDTTTVAMDTVKP